MYDGSDTLYLKRFHLLLKMSALLRDETYILCLKEGSDLDLLYQGENVLRIAY